MSKKVYEIAKELEMESKELLERLNAMGIEAKSHSSAISEIDAKAVKNMVLHSRKKTAETKIVKAAPQKKTAGKKTSEKEVKIEVKPAQATTLKHKGRQEPRLRAEIKPSPEKPTQQARTSPPPQGTPVPRAASVPPPIGKPLPKAASQQPIKPKIESENEKNEPEKVSVSSSAPDKKTVEVDQKIQNKAEAPVQEETIKGSVVPQKLKIIEQAKDRPKTEQPVKKATPPAAASPKPPQKRKPEQGKTDPQQSARRSAQDRPVSPRQTKVDPAAPVAPTTPAKKTRQDKPGDKKTRPDPRSANKKRGPGVPRSMEKPALKKPRRQKQEKPVVEDVVAAAEEMELGTKIINVPITVKGLSEQIEKSTSEIIMGLMKLGIMANVNQNLDEDTVLLLGDELNVPIRIDKVGVEIVEEGLEIFDDKEEDLKSRPPIITVMGHVDHGKTSLLDAIRRTKVTDTESGGITQHIGASEVMMNGQKIVFLDTPGHEAFTAMRARGAHVTDIAILVVAADDSVKPQTIESISHARAAGVPIIVAINKMDKEDVNPDRVKQDLASLSENKILVEEYGGETICVPVSAKTGEGIDQLLEMILLQAEVLELKANPNRLAMGTVIEARLDKAKGPVTTLLVTNGTLESGMSLVAGTSYGRIRAMTNFKGVAIRKAGPATAVEILGLSDVPEAGDEFNALKDDKLAREIAEQRKMKVREEVMVRNSSITLEQLFSQIQAGEVKELNLIVKADVQGSVGALTQSLEKLQTENVKVRILHAGVGTVTESDIMLASTSNAIIIGFNIRPSSNISTMADRENVEIRTYRIIYEVIDEIESALKGMLDPIYKEVVMGKIEIRETFKVPGIGIIGGAYVLEGKVQRNAQIRLVRDGIVIHEGKISSLKRFKDDAREVAQGYECGIGIDNYNDIKEGDIVEAFKMEEIERK